MGEGLITVIDGQRIYLRVYRRLFYPVIKKVDGEVYKFYSDTGREREINYKRAAYYDLENPFNRIRLIRLARAMNAIRCIDLRGGIRECTIIICNNRELFDLDSDDDYWVPFDPSNMESLSDKITKVKRKREWGEESVVD